MLKTLQNWLLHYGFIVKGSRWLFFFPACLPVIPVMVDGTVPFVGQ